LASFGIAVEHSEMTFRNPGGHRSHRLFRRRGFIVTAAATGHPGPFALSVDGALEAADALSGCYLSVDDDLEAMVAEAQKRSKARRV
jgi:hypothetical protein